MSPHKHPHHLAGQRLWLAVAVNVLLTIAQIIGGILAGSLALIADALHNLSDASSLVLALVAQNIARKPADDVMTFGYGRAEIIAALINFTTLIILGGYLIYEALARALKPEPITGWIVVVVAAIALVIDLITAWLTHAMAKDSMNMRAAFLHNLTDALASVGVIVAGFLVIHFEWWLADAAITLIIAGYVLYHGVSEIGGAIRILMSGTPEGSNMPAIIRAMAEVPGVEDIHHVHLWAIDEHRASLEAHVVTETVPGAETEALKARLKSMLRERFNVHHTTLEFEYHKPSASQLLPSNCH